MEGNKKKEVFLKKEIEEIKLFQEAFFESLDVDFFEHIKAKYKIVSKLKQYSDISIRQRYDLVKILYSNLQSGVFPTEEDCERAKAIMCNILLTITYDDLNNCEIIEDLPDMS